jgi:hypothetical protein
MTLQTEHATHGTDRPAYATCSHILEGQQCQRLYPSVPFEGTLLEFGCTSQQQLALGPLAQAELHYGCLLFIIVRRCRVRARRHSTQRSLPLQFRLCGTKEPARALVGAAY